MNYERATKRGDKCQLFFSPLEEQESGDAVACRQVYHTGPANSNVCPEGYGVIATEASCRAAAGAYEKTFDMTTTEEGWPKGCYMYDSAYLFFNNHSTGSSNPHASPICEQAWTRAPTPTPTAPPTCLNPSVLNCTYCLSDHGARMMGGIFWNTPLEDCRKLCHDNDHNKKTYNGNCVAFSFDHSRDLCRLQVKCPPASRVKGNAKPNDPKCNKWSAYICEDTA